MAYKEDIEGTHQNTEKPLAVMQARNLTFSYDGVTNVIEHLDLDVWEGKITVLLGANGCGKSTLFKLMTKNLFPDDGETLLYGNDADDMGLKEFARNVAIVHQNNTAPPDLTVETLVGYGRTPYLNAFQTAGGKEDDEAIRWAMDVTNVTKYRKRQVSQLSGGQRQRAWIAMALAMKTSILYLDEPTSFLDVRYQIEILKLVRSLNRDYGITIIMVLHDINQAMEYADILVGMKGGKIIAEGNPREIVTPELLETLYGIRLPMIETGGRKFVLTV